MARIVHVDVPTWAALGAVNRTGDVIPMRCCCVPGEHLQLAPRLSLSRRGGSHSCSNSTSVDRRISRVIGMSNWYLYRLHRVVYGRSGYSSVLRTITLDVVYLFVLLSGLLTAVILGALSL